MIKSKTGWNLQIWSKEEEASTPRNLLAEIDGSTQLYSCKWLPSPEVILPGIIAMK